MMPVEQYCLKMMLKKLSNCILRRKVVLFDLQHHFILKMQGMLPKTMCHHCWGWNSLTNRHNLFLKSTLLPSPPTFYSNTLNLKYKSHDKQGFIKEVRQQHQIKAVKGHEVIKGVQRAIMNKKKKFHQTEECLKNSSRKMFANLKETKSKVKEKVEEIIERENIYTVPNLLCLSRIAISPLLGYLILEHDFHLALGLLGVAGITDLLDGWIARTFKSQASNLGTFLDPMADKILIATMFLTLTYAGIVPVFLTGLIITRDVVLVCAGFIIRYKSLPPPRTLSRYFDVTHATAKLAPTFISKCNTMVQLVTLASTLAAPVFSYLEHPLLHTLWCVTAGTTVLSAASYVMSKNSFKFLKKTP